MSYEFNLLRLRTVANILVPFKDQIVFVGGATVCLYVERPELTTIRPTEDVDVVIELITTMEYYQLQSKLLSLGFSLDKEAPILSRFLYQGVKVDFMPTDPSILGFSNRWYKGGIREKIRIGLDVTTDIHIFSLPYFLASKMEAFCERGKGDLYESRDLEDIIYVIDNRPTVHEDIVAAPEEVRSFLVEQFSLLTKNPLFEEALLGHVERRDPLNRVKRIVSIIKELQSLAMY